MTIRVFIVDDHRVLVETLTTALDSFEDINVVGSADCVAVAGEAIPRLSPDVALVDLSLPDGEGTHLVRHLRSTSPATRVIVLTGRTGAEPFLHDLGGDYFLRRHDPAKAATKLIRQLNKLGYRVTLDPVEAA